jgi:hypothetical protein
MKARHAKRQRTAWPTATSQSKKKFGNENQTLAIGAEVENPLTKLKAHVFYAQR